MKLKRIMAMPFALVADVVTLGNMGERPFTQQLFDAERRERSMEHEKALIELAIAIAAAAVRAPGKS
jgi:hypothetical protein